MVISALPMLKMLGERTAVAMTIESRLESAIARYSPGQPRLVDRLSAAEGLRKQGVTVNAVVSPLLPYGDLQRDAWDFAELLDRHSDYITLGCLAAGRPADEAQLRALPLAQRLVADKEFRLLRPHAYRYLYQALKVIAPEKLLLKKVIKNAPSQLNLFAAA